MKKILTIISILFFFSCTEDDYVSTPTVKTIGATVLENGGIRLLGEINNLVGQSNYGFVISTYEGGTLNTFNTIKSSFGKVDGKFSIDIRNGLIEGETYYFNVFVKHENFNPYLQYEGNYLLGEEMSFVSNGSASPIIDKVVPSIAHVGDIITISGKYFSDDFEVYFNDKKANVLFKRDSATQVIVPFDYSRKEPYNNISIKKSTNETTIFHDFSMYKPEIIKVEPYYANERDTISIIGNHFNLINEQNELYMDVYGNYSRLDIIESSRTKIKFVNAGWFYDLYPHMRLKSQFQSLDFNDKFQAKLPTITNGPNCLSYGKTATIYGKDFPRANSYTEPHFSLTIGGKSFSLANTSRDSIVLNIEDDFYTDFLLDDIVIEYLGETITYETDICVDEPWIKVSTDNPQHQPHNYQNKTYGVVSQNNNTFITVGRLNTETYDFESVINKQLPESIRYGDLRTWHQDKMYHYDISPNINKFYSYNFLNGDLKELAPFPGAQRVNGLMTCVGNYIYLGLGINNSYDPFDDIWRYSIEDDQWEFVLSYPGIKTYQDAITDPLIFAFDNRLFFGGTNQNNNSNLFWEMDLNTFSLLERANVPIYTAHGLKGVTIDSKGYFESYYLYEYDVLQDQWITHEDIQGIGFLYNESRQSLFTNNGNIYRSVTTSASYYKLLFKMNMSYLEH